MILQSLAEYYDTLVEKGILATPGWQLEKVSFALVINEGGSLIRIDDLRQEEVVGKTKKMMPRQLIVPAREKRSVNICSNFLCDNATYLLGLDTKDKPNRAELCFKECARMHQDLLKNTNSNAAIAIKKFFQQWNPKLAAHHVLITPIQKELGTANLVFEFDGRFVQEDAACRAAWDQQQTKSDDDTFMQCLITGERSPIAILHPSIKGIPGAQSSGASLVSFNARAFESYGQQDGQGRNAPVSEKAAFAYSAALQWMINSPKHHTRLGDMTIVYWAETANDGMDALLSLLLNDDEKTIDQSSLHQTIVKLASGQTVDWNDFPIKPANRYYILGLSPNAARLSVRFFQRDTFGSLAEHVAQFNAETRIIHAIFEKDTLPLWQLLRETANQQSKKKEASPQLAGDMLRAVITGKRFPETLFNQLQLRLRAECGDVTYGKAALIKAYLTRNGSFLQTIAKEALTVELNDQTDYAPYLLGRLFAILEKTQQAANPDINTTIRDRYFTSACATPSVIFPRLISLSQAHVKKLKNTMPGAAINYSKLFDDIMGRLTSSFPSRLSLQDQGIFQIGYYHQKQQFFNKKEDKENV